MITCPRRRGTFEVIFFNNFFDTATENYSGQVKSHVDCFLIEMAGEHA